MKAEELALTLKQARQPGDGTVTIEFENGARQVIRPSKAFGGYKKDLADAMAGNLPHKVVDERDR